MKIQFEEKKLRPETLRIIEMCNEILEEYEAEGYSLTVRQLYYQLVAGDLFPDERKWAWTGTRWVKDPDGTINAQPNYDWLSGVVNDGRMAGLIDWDLIVDRGRRTHRDPHWATPKKALESIYDWFSIDRWRYQPIHVEVMCEKQALEGVLHPACQALDLPFTSNKGYSSQSFMFVKGRELGRYFDRNKDIHVLYFGDHDPSGLDMDRDVQERLEMFMLAGLKEEDDRLPWVNFQRLALTLNQVEEYKPPPNPAKITDSRGQGYIDRFGPVSWELDALKPHQLVDLLNDRVNWLIDEYGSRDNWDAALDMESRMKSELEAIHKTTEDFEWWEEISELHDLLER